jgi:ubiquitin-activating enzyme E1
LPPADARDTRSLDRSQLVTEVSKTEFKPNQRYITFEICCNDADDEDVEVPFVRYKFRGW